MKRRPLIFGQIASWNWSELRFGEFLGFGQSKRKNSIWDFSLDFVPRKKIGIHTFLSDEYASKGRVEN